MLCRGGSGILIVDLTVYGRWHLLPVRCQPPCSDGFACLRSDPLLPNPTGATVWSWDSKLWIFESRSLHQKHLRKHNFGTAASYRGLQVVLSEDAKLCVREDRALLIVDLTFNGQCQHLLQVRHQLPCSDCFSCPGIHRSSLVNRTGATMKLQ